MFRVRSDLCRGCGICIDSCPQQAISMVSGMAYIIQERCNQCRRCLEVCPQEAIIEVAPVSADDLKISVAGLKNETEEIIARIEKLSKKQNEYKLEKS